MSARWVWVALLVPACGGLEPCDIREAWCQDDVFYAVLDARGDTWDAWASPPEIRVMSVAGYRDTLEAAFGSSSESYDLWDEALTLVGMVDPTADLARASIESRVANTVAFYSPSSRGVTIIDHGEPTRKSRDTEILAHEFVHAVQDRYDGLRAIEGDALTTDEWFAARSMVEGEAVLFATLVIAGTAGHDFDNLNWQRMFDIWRESMDEDVAASPARFTEAVRRYVYPFGGQHMADAFAAGGNPEVQRWLYDAPRSAVEVLDGPGGPEPSPAIECASPAPQGYRLEGQDVLGAIGAFALLNDDSASARAWWAQARTWQSDLFRVFQSESGNTAVSWRLRWSSASRARAFAATLEHRPLDWRLVVEDTEVVIAAASDGALFETWLPTACE